jgi:hypothetical protein
MALPVDELNAATKKGYLNEAVVQSAYDQSAFYKMQWMKGFVEVLDGGSLMEFPVRYKKQGTGEIADPRSQLQFQSVATRTAGQVNWGFARAVTMLYWDEKVKNAGAAKVFDLAADRMTELRDEITDLLCTKLLTVDAAPGNFDLWSLNFIIDSANTYAGITIADAANWTSTEDNATTTLTIFGTTSLTAAVANSTLGIYKPSLHLTTRLLYAKYMSLLTPNQIYQDTETAALGFSNILLIDAPVVGDAYLPVGYWLGIDMDAFEVRTDGSGTNGIDLTDWIDLTPVGYVNSAGKVATFAGQVICRRRRTSFKFDHLLAAN